MKETILGKIIGIYKITCSQNKKTYIGKSVNVKSRINKHYSDLERGRHYNTYLQKSWNKYGKKNFKDEILEECEKYDLEKQEIFYIGKYNSKTPNGFNMTDGGDGCLGRTVSESVRRKIAKKHIGKKLSDDTKRKMSESRIGKYSGVNSPLFGKKKTELSRKRMSENHADFSGENHPRYGMKLSLVTRMKLSKSNSGIKKKSATSNYHGVSKKTYKNTRTYWQAEIKVLGKYIYIGTFNIEVDAAKAYNNYLIKYNIDRPLNTIGEPHEN